MKLIVIALLTYLPSTEVDQPKSPDTIVCDVVRWYYERYGEKAAREYTVSHKWSKARIAEAEKCIRK